MIFKGVLLVAVLSFTAAAHGQTTRPAEKTSSSPVTPAVEAAWPKLVETFAKSLVEGNLNQAEAALMPKADIHRFDSTKLEEPARLVERSAKSTLIGQHAYIHPALVMAADIAADFKNASTLPDKVKARFIVDDENDIKRANATAVQWVVDALDVRPGTPLGVIILWVDKPLPPNAPADAAPQFEAIFVLVRGEEVTAREYKINSIVYGNPGSEGN